MSIIRFGTGDKLVMKKPHPCGNNEFSILRCGSDVRIKCDKCLRDLTVDRVKLEKMIKRVITSVDSDM